MDIAPFIQRRLLARFLFVLAKLRVAAASRDAKPNEKIVMKVASSAQTPSLEMNANESELK